MSLPLTAAVAELKLTPASIITLLQTLHSQVSAIGSLSKVDLKHLTSRTIGLLKKHDLYSVWCGTNIISVLIDSSVVVAAEGSVFFAVLLKVWTSPEGRNKNVMRSIVECLNKLCLNIRGKPTLTREVLTPNLKPLLSAYLEKLEEYPDLIVPSLQTLVLEHPTTSRPFGNSIKAKLLCLLSKDLFMSYPSQLRSEVCSLLATLTAIEKEGPEKFWAQDVARIIANLARTLNVYSSFLSIADDDETARVLKLLADLDSNEIFPPLHIDTNQPSTILLISTRLSLLVELIKGYLFLCTTFAVNVPLGQIMAILDTAFSINTRFVSFRRELRDPVAKEYVSISLTKTHRAILGIMAQLPANFSSAVIPHMVNVFANLELLVFLQQNRIDRSKVLANEQFSCQIVACTSRYLALTAYVKDFSQLSRIVDLAILLVEPRTASVPKKEIKTEASNIHSKSARKNANKGGPVVLADLLSHEHLFTKNVPSSTKDTVLEFFSSVIRKSQIAPTQYNRLIKFAVTETVQLMSKSKFAAVPNNVKDVLVAALLHPGANAASIYSIASSIASSLLLSLVQNPRFPPLPTLVKKEVEELDSEDTSEPIQKKQKFISVATRFDPEPLKIEPVEVFAAAVETSDCMNFKDAKSQEKDGEVEKVETDIENGEIGNIVPKLVVEKSLKMDIGIDDQLSDSGSEIEIPELEMDSD